MKFTLEISPLSNNKAWQGRHIKTDDYRKFEKDIYRILRINTGELSKKEMFVHYVYHLKNYGNSDTANMEKTLTDMLVKMSYLMDDRYIKAIYQRKERLQEGEENEYIDIIIEDWDGQDTQNH